MKLMHFFKKISDMIFLRTCRLQVRLAVMFSIICIAASALLICTALSSYSKQMQEQIYDKDLSTLRGSCVLLDFNLEQYSKLSKQILSNTQIRTILSDTAEHTPSETYAAMTQVKQLFGTMTYNLSINEIASIAICSIDGRVFSSYDLAANIQTYDNEFYRKIKESSSPFVIFPTEKYTLLRSYPRNTFAIGRLIRDDALNEIGYVLIFISADDFFSDSLNKMALNKESIYYVVSDDGSIMHVTDETKESMFQEEIISSVKNDLEDNYIFDLNGVQYLVTRSRSSYSNWTLVSVSELSVITSTVEKTVHRFLIVFAVVSCSIIGLSAMIAYEITHPLKKMQAVMQQITTGNMSLRVQEFESPDMNNLSSQFNSMLDRIEALIQENDKKSKLLLQTELQMLRAQINPHFVYNTLNSIGWLAVFNGQPQIKAQLSNLTTLLRNAYSNPHQLVTLKSEQQLLSSYTDIMKLRYDNFEIEFDLAENTENCLISKFSLQPIVENSIIHGFPELERQGKIVIHSFLDTDNKKTVLVLIIEDNGTGISDERMQEVLSQKRDNSSFNNIGIYNVDRQIKLRFGTEYGLAIHSVCETGTTVKVTFPFMMKEDSDD